MIEVYTDAATEGKGISGIGIVIIDNKKTYEYALPLENKLSNHEAEFIAVIKALEICEDKFPGEILSFRSDAKVVVDTIEKNFTRNETFRPHLMKIKEIADKFPYFFIKWIPNNMNNHADILARRALRMRKA